MVGSVVHPPHGSASDAELVDPFRTRVGVGAREERRRRGAAERGAAGSIEVEQPVAFEAPLEIDVLTPARALDPAAGVNGAPVKVARVMCHPETMSAVTIPNMPVWPSACPRMWQWNAHAPTASAVTIASHRSPGATFRVSHLNGAGSG